MKSNQSPSQEKNHINDNERNKLLHFFLDNQINHETQKYFYERGDQSSQDNGAAKYINTTHNSLYEQYISTQEAKLLEKLDIRKELQNFNVIFDLGPGEGQVLKYLNNLSQIYRPVDVSAYVLDQIKKNKDIKIEGTINDWFSSTAFSESKGEKSYVSLKNLPNLDDQEIEILLNKFTPTHNGKSKLIISYFPDFNESQENIDTLKAIYGDGNKENPYYDKNTYEKSAERIIGGFTALGFDKDNIHFIVEYDKENHRILEGVEITKDTNINGFKRKTGDKIMPCQSRRLSADYIEKLAEKTGWKIQKHIKNKWISVAIFEKNDPHKKQNSIKKRAKIGLLTLGLGTTIVGSKVIHDQYQKDIFIENKQKQIEENLLLSYSAAQIAYFNEQINETKQIIKTFYGIKDDGYINGLIRPYMMAHPELIEYITQQKSSSGSISPVQTEISEYVAMLIMKDQENHNFLEYFGDDDLGYKKFDAYIPNMLQTLQYYDSIQTINGSYKINPNQEIMIPASNYSQLSPDLSGGTKKEIGSGISRGGKKVRVFIVSYSPAIVNNLPSYKNMIATTDKDVGPSDMFETTAFIKNFLSYRHQTKYLARQAAQYLTDELNKNNAEIDKYGTLQRLPKFEHIIQEYVLHGGETKIYLQNPQIGEKVFNDLILTNQKILKYFKDHVAIDLQTMQKFPEYEQRHGKMALSRGESSAYRNNPDYQEANKNFYKRD